MAGAIRLIDNFQLISSKAVAVTPYLGKDPTDSFREYKLFWIGNTEDITFIVGHECEYGIDCAEQGKEGEPGTCMTKQIIITSENDTPADIDQTNLPSAIHHKLIKDGVLFIEHNGHLFNAQGARVK